MLSVLGFLAVLGPLVVVHEFGHFIFARIFGVKAEVFSVGFGPRLFQKQWGETEFRVSWIPLGGYVKLLGAEPEEQLSPEDQKRALSKQAPWKRFFIFFGGPLFNFIFAVMVFMAILVIGEQQVASVVGRVLPGSDAEKAGVHAGDRIVAVDGQAIRKFEELATALHDAGEKASLQVVLSVLRQGMSETDQPKQVVVKVRPEQGFSIYGEEKSVGTIEGLYPASRIATIGVSDPVSVAGKFGIQTGDRVTEWNGEKIVSWEDLEQRVSDLAVGSSAVLTVVSKNALSAPLKLPLKKATAGQSLEGIAGLASSELFVETAVVDSPAAAAGLQAGDRLVAVGGAPIHSFFELKDSIQSNGEKGGEVEIAWIRGGERFSKKVVPTATQTRDPLLKKTVVYTIGVVPQLSWAEPEYVTERVLNPFTLVWKASERMVIFSWRNIVSIRKMLTGDVSVATIGGPILIGKIAGESLGRGLIAFLTTMAVLSVGLGVLNLLPVPVLDGGHLLLLGLEMIRGKPLSLRQMEVVQQVGLSLILLLMVVVIKNDLSRLPIFN